MTSIARSVHTIPIRQ